VRKTLTAQLEERTGQLARMIERVKALESAGADEKRRRSAAECGENEARGRHEELARQVGELKRQAADHDRCLGIVRHLIKMNRNKCQEPAYLLSLVDSILAVIDMPFPELLAMKFTGVKATPSQVYPLDVGSSGAGPAVTWHVAGKT
jgi:hypothetical protein